MISHRNSSAKVATMPSSQTSDAKLVKSAAEALSKLASLESPTIDNVRDFSKLLNQHQHHIFHASVLPHFENAFRGFLRVYGSQERSASDDSTNKWISALSAASARMLEVKRRFQHLVEPDVERIFQNLEQERKIMLLPARRKIQEFNAPPPLELPHAATSSSPLPPGAGAPFAPYQHIYPPLNGNPSLSDAFQCSTAEHAFIALCSTLKTGKLHAIARELFCRAYGLHGRFREDHTALTEAARMCTHSSTTHINALLYGNMFEKLLADLRAAVSPELRTREAYGITQHDPPEAVERLRSVARPLFERGYGLNGRIEERRIALSNEAMALTGCSWNTIQKLWYEGLFEELDDLRHLLRPSQRARQSGRMQHFIYNNASTPLLGAATAVPGSLASMLSSLPPLSQNSIAMQHNQNDYSGSLPPLRRSPFLSSSMSPPLPSSSSSLPSPSLLPSAPPSSVTSSPSLRSIPHYQGLHLDRLLSSRTNSQTKSLEYLAQMLHPSGGLHSRVWLSKEQLITRPDVIEAFEEEMGDKVKQEDMNALDDLAAAGAAHTKKKKKGGDATAAAAMVAAKSSSSSSAKSAAAPPTAEKSPVRKRKRIVEEQEEEEQEAAAEETQATPTASAHQTKSRVKPEPGLPRTPEVTPAVAPSTPNTRSSKAAAAAAATVKQEQHSTVTISTRALIQAPDVPRTTPQDDSSSSSDDESAASASSEEEPSARRHPPPSKAPNTTHRATALTPVSPPLSASASALASPPPTTTAPTTTGTSVSNLTDLLRAMKTKPQFIVIDAENLGRWGGSGEADGNANMTDSVSGTEVNNSDAVSSSNVRFESWQLSACIKSVERCISDANLRAQVVCCLPERYFLAPSANAVKDAWVLNELQKQSKLHRLPSGIDTQMEMVKLVLHGDTFLITNDPLLQPQQARLVSSEWVQNRTLQYYTFGLAFQRGCEACRAMREQGPNQIATDLKKEAEKCALSCMGSVFLASKTIYASPTTETQSESAPSKSLQQSGSEDRRKKKKQKN